MNFSMRHAVLLACLMAPVLPAAPQDGGTPRMTVKVRFEPKSARPGDKVKLVIDGQIDPGYHVYGALEQTGTVPSLKLDPVPTSAAGKGQAAALRADGAFQVPPGTLHVDPAVPDIQSYWLQDSARFEQTFVVTKAAVSGELTFRGELVYMACTERFCDPPYTEKVSARLTVVGGVDPKAMPAAETGAAKTGAAKTGAAKTGAAKTGAAKTGAAKTGAAETGAAKTGAAKPVGDPKAGGAQDKLSPTHDGQQQTMRIKLVPATARAGEQVSVEIHTSMAPRWHNYGALQNPELGEPVKMKVTAAGLTPVGEPQIPPGHEEVIEGVGTLHILEGEWVMRQVFRVPEGTRPGALPVTVDVRYTACDESNCLDPVDARLGSRLTIEAGPTRAEYAKAGAAPAGPPTDKPGQQVKAGKPAGGTDGKKFVELANDEFFSQEDPNDLGLWLYLLGAVGAGLFALVMPCTYPMIPLTVSFFTKQAEAKGGQPVFLALAYGGGIVASYLVLGGFLGPFMQVLAADPYLNLVFGLAFVFFALSLFGMVDLKPPQFLMNSATKAQGMAAGSKSGIGAVFPVFLMGVTLCVTSFACTAPFLGSMLAAGASQGGQGRLLLGMGVFGLTMALPFVVLSLVPGRLPRGGAWMNSAKVLFGFVELAAALKFFSNAEYAWDWLVLPREVFLVIWAMLFLIAGIYMLGLIKLKGETGEIGGGRLVTGSAVLVLAGYFALGASGYKFDNIVMTAFEPPYPEAPAHTVVEDDFDRAVQVASTAQKLLLVNFTGKT